MKFTLILMSTLFAEAFNGGNVVQAPIERSGYTLAQCEAEALRWEGTRTHEGIYYNGDAATEMRQAHCVAEPAEPVEETPSNLMHGVPFQTR